MKSIRTYLLATALLGGIANAAEEITTDTNSFDNLGTEVGYDSFSKLGRATLVTGTVTGPVARTYTAAKDAVTSAYANSTPKATATAAVKACINAVTNNPKKSAAALVATGTLAGIAYRNREVIKSTVKSGYNKAKAATKSVCSSVVSAATTAKQIAIQAKQNPREFVKGSAIAVKDSAIAAVKNNSKKLATLAVAGLAYYKRGAIADAIFTRIGF